MMALAPHTSKIFEQVCKLKCINNYYLVGGTALALQLQHRLSEDLDFMSWITHKNQKPEVDWVKIEKELSEIGSIDAREIWDFDHVEFVVSGVKVSFYASSKYTPVTASIPFKDNLHLSDIMAIGAMKMEVMMRRSNFRDYYDIYSILINGYDLKEIITKATVYSGHLLSTKNLLAMLVDSKRFYTDSNFPQLQPKYKVTASEIEEYIKMQIRNTF
jgi:predicted nucleotidyltransferase component of viral defense system